MVPESVADPLGYYLNNTVKTRSLIAAAVTAGIPRFVFSSTAAVYGNPAINPVFENAVLNPMSPYGRSKLMSEWMLRDTHAAHGLQYAALRYFNVAGADPKGRTGQSTPRATHLIKVACQTALGQRGHLDVFGTDYPTPGRHLRARLYPCQRSCRGPSRCSQAICAMAARAASSIAAMAVAIRCSRWRMRSSGRQGGSSISGSPAGGRAIRRRSSPVPSGREAILGWEPRHEDLDGIVASALAWENHLIRRNASA